MYTFQQDARARLTKCVRFNVKSAANYLSRVIVVCKKGRINMRWLGIVLAVVFFATLSVLNKKMQTESHVVDGVIKQPRHYLYVGILGVVCFIIIAVVFFVQSDVAAGVFMLVVTAPYVVLIIFSINWKVEFDESGFAFTNLFKRTKKFLYSDVTVTDTGRGLRVYNGKKKVFAASFLLANVEDFHSKYKAYCKV